MIDETGDESYPMELFVLTALTLRVVTGVLVRAYV